MAAEVTSAAAAAQGPRVPVGEELEELVRRLELGELLAPACTVERFFAEVFEKEPLVVRHDKLFFAGLFSIWDVEAALVAADDNDILLRKDRKGETEDWKGRAPHVTYLEGGSIIVNHLDRVNARVAALCQRLARELVHTYCVMYLTPPDAQAVRAHSDHQDVFILQLQGSKTWQVYGPDPANGALVYGDEVVGKANPVSELGDVLLSDLRLEQGDVLYIPRGFVHEACTPTESVKGSLHLTITVPTHDFTLGAAALRIMETAMRSDFRSRSALTMQIPRLRAHSSMAALGGSECAASGADRPAAAGTDAACEKDEQKDSSSAAASDPPAQPAEPPPSPAATAAATAEGGEPDDAGLGAPAQPAEPPPSPAATAAATAEGGEPDDAGLGALFKSVFERAVASLSFSKAVDAFGEHASKSNLTQKQRMEELLAQGTPKSILEPHATLMVMPGMSFSFRKIARKSCHAPPPGTPMALVKHPEKRFGLEMTIIHGTNNLTQGIDEDHLEQLQMIAATTTKDKAAGAKGKGKKKGKGKASTGGLHNPRPFTIAELPGDDIFGNMCLCMLLQRQGVLQVS
jgi:hypothetical protein